MESTIALFVCRSFSKEHLQYQPTLQQEYAAAHMIQKKMYITKNFGDIHFFAYIF